MTNIVVERKWKFLLAILIIQALVFSTIIFDIKIARQTICFLFYSFIPGFVIVRLLRLNRLNRLAIALFSVGFSIAFLMFSGLLVNEIGLIFGVSQSLSLLPLLIAQTSLIILGAGIVSLRGDGQEQLGSRAITSLSSKSLAVLVCLPILSIAGAMCLDLLKSNLIPLFVIVLISALFSVVIIGEKRLPHNIFPLAVFVIGISLLYGSSLISRNIVSFRSDVPAEYYVQRTTQNSGHWSSVFPVAGDIAYGRLNAMLSITILPTVYSVLLNVDSSLVFKALFPAIFALVPLCLYLFWESEVGTKGAFIAAFLLMAQFTFFSEMLGLQRQMIGEVFLALLLFLVSSKRIDGWARSGCFVLLSAGLVVSHYALAELFLFFMVIVYFYLIVVKRPSRKITLPMIVLFLVIMFSWYLFTSNAAVLDSFVSFGNHVYSQLNQFLNPESRGQTVMRGLGLETAPTIWNSVGRAFAYITELLIVIGFVALMIKKTDSHFEKEQHALSMVAVTLLAALIIVPGLANTLGIARFYHILLFMLAALLVVGVESVVRLAFKRDQMRKLFASILLVSVLVPYFLFQSGLVYELTGSENFSLPLGKNRMSQSYLRTNIGYFDETEVIGALWLSKNVDLGTSRVYADAASVYGVLIDYGAVNSQFMETFSNTTMFPRGSVIYLDKPNVVDEIAVGLDFMWNTTDLSSVLDHSNSVYSNGGSQIYDTS
jgi:uncharacterized membrane protein